jgi:orotate phosphoribosyltransferase
MARIGGPWQQRAAMMIADKAVTHLDEPVELASGKMSTVFVDGKHGLADPADLEVACRAIIEMAEAAGCTFDHVGGPTLGADHLAIGVALFGSRRWFIVRKERKGRGTGRLIEGARIGAGDAVLLVEDVCSTGGSLLKALRDVRATGAVVTHAATLVDRGVVALQAFAEQGVELLAVTTWEDLGIDPIDGL